MDQIFVSFSTENRESVEPIVRELQHGFCGNVFYYLEQDCSSAPLIPDTLIREIENSQAFICFLSEAAGKSRWVQGEVDVALEKLDKERVRFVRLREGSNKIPAAFQFRCHTGTRVIFENDFRGPREVAAEIRHSLDWVRWRPDVDVQLLLEEYLRHRETYLWRADPGAPAGALAIREPERHDQTPACLYSELTGFFISESIRLYDLTGDEMFLHEASGAARWLVGSAMDKEGGGILTRHYFARDAGAKLETTSFSGRQVYAFDTAICLIALTDLTKRWGHLDSPDRATGERRYNFKTEARQLGDFICDTLMRERSDDDKAPLAAVYSLCEQRPLPDENRWSRRFGPHHARVAEALAELHHLTRNRKYRDCALRICDAILRFQDPEGDLETSPGMTELHPFAYGAEGLMRVGELLNQPHYVDAARLMVEWSLDLQSDDGSIAQCFRDGMPVGPAGQNYRTDALGQVLLVAAKLGLAEEDREYRPKVDRLVHFLMRLENGSGVFPFGFLDSGNNDFPRCKTRSYWPGMYAIDALITYQVSRLAHDARVIVLAGGRGTRLWPLSCTRVPKPLSSAMLGNRSLLEETLQRYTRSRLIPAENVYVLCSGGRNRCSGGCFR